MGKIDIEHLNLRYSDGTESLRDVTFSIPPNQITVIFGPAGGGKSSLLRVINRLNDIADVVMLSGRVTFNGQNILDPALNVIQLRRKIGIVFSRPVVLPLTIYENVSFGLEMAGEKRGPRMDELVEKSLRLAVLWDEVKDRLNDPATAISGGQQQRLCLARVFALEPEVILLDEPTSALDPVSTARIEALMQELKEQYTFVLAPHNVQQAARMADMAAFFLQGELVEVAQGKTLFVNPRDQRTQDYVEGRFG
ncbi:MAG TPA: phosphate ABC transporter ATP-binding protein [Anaerolineaceae bacterium]